VLQPPLALTLLLFVNATSGLCQKVSGPLPTKWFVTCAQALLKLMMWTGWYCHGVNLRCCLLPQQHWQASGCQDVLSASHLEGTHVGGSVGHNLAGAGVEM
jgi:hypothetical protein